LSVVVRIPENSAASGMARQKEKRLRRRFRLDVLGVLAVDLKPQISLPDQREAASG
jgi:hypothetical protein